jgi:hypothetical protein
LNAPFISWPPLNSRKLVWMFALDPAKVLAGQDGSYPGFYLPIQYSPTDAAMPDGSEAEDMRSRGLVKTSNHLAQWTRIASDPPPPTPQRRLLHPPHRRPFRNETRPVQARADIRRATCRRARTQRKPRKRPEPHPSAIESTDSEVSRSTCACDKRSEEILPMVAALARKSDIAGIRVKTHRPPMSAMVTCSSVMLLDERRDRFDLPLRLLVEHLARPPVVRQEQAPQARLDLELDRADAQRILALQIGEPAPGELGIPFRAIGLDEHLAAEHAAKKRMPEVPAKKRGERDAEPCTRCLSYIDDLVWMAAQKAAIDQAAARRNARPWGTRRPEKM